MNALAGLTVFALERLAMTVGCAHNPWWWHPAVEPGRGGDERTPAGTMVQTVTFEPPAGLRTRLTIRKRMISAGILESMDRIGMSEGWSASLGRLRVELPSLAGRPRRTYPVPLLCKEPSMARVSTYLNFPRNTETAFQFYRSVFGTEFIGPVHRFGDVPSAAGRDELAEADKNLVMHIELPILAGHVLMGTDAPESMGYKIAPGNNSYINLEPDTREETERLFNALAAGGRVEMSLQDMFWGAYFGSLVDRFGVHWMFNCNQKT